MESFNYKTILYIYLFAIIDAKWQNCQLILTLWFWFTTIWFPTSRIMYSSIYVYNSWNTNQPWILVVLFMWEVCFWKFLKHWIKFGIKVFYSKWSRIQKGVEGELLPLLECYLRDQKQRVVLNVKLQIGKK